MWHKEDELDLMLENDQISPEEQGFLVGYFSTY